MVERKLIFFFFLRLGVFEPAKLEWAGQTPELVPAGCEGFVGESGVWKEKFDQGPDGEEDCRGVRGAGVGSSCRAEIRICLRGGAQLPSCPTHLPPHGAQWGVYMWGTVGRDFLPSSRSLLKRMVADVTLFV